MHHQQFPQPQSYPPTSDLEEEEEENGPSELSSLYPCQRWPLYPAERPPFSAPQPEVAAPQTADLYQNQHQQQVTGQQVVAPDLGLSQLQELVALSIPSLHLYPRPCPLPKNANHISTLKKEDKTKHTR